MDEPPQKRFKYASYNEQLSNISVEKGKGKGLAWEKEDFDDAEQTHTPFTSELERLSLLDLTTSFQALHRSLVPLTTSLPITLHNLPSISTIFYTFYDGLRDGEEHEHSGLDSALQLHQALFETCLGEAASYIPETTRHLLRVGALRALEPKLVERTYSTLSLILRTLASHLLKQAHAVALRQTWRHVRPYLRPRANKPVVRRCVADAWIGVVRKARNDALGRLVDIMLQEEGELQAGEGMEAIWAGSLKGSTGQLHSRALPLVDMLLDRLVAAPSEAGVETMRMVVVALVHHCSSANFAPIIEAVSSRLDGRASSQASSSSSSSSAKTLDPSSSTAMLSLLSASLLTRKGKRFPEQLLKPTMLKLVSLLPHLSSATATATSGDSAAAERQMRDSWRRLLVSCVVGCLQAGKLAQWLSPGVTLIEGLWANLENRESFAFVNMLVSLQWAGIEQFILPHVAKTAIPSLETQPLPTLILLNNLAAAGYLSGGLSNVQGGRWRQSLISALQSLLSTLVTVPLTETDTDRRRVLVQALRLVPSLAKDAERFVDPLTQLLCRLVDGRSGDARADWMSAGPWSESHLLGVLLECTDQLVGNSAIEAALRQAMLDEGRFEAIMKTWAWNREILSGLAGFAELWSDVLSSKGVETECLQPNLLTADSTLRLATLRILAATHPIASTSTATSVGAIYTSCLEVEQSDMTLKNVRERPQAIARLGRLLLTLPAGSDDALRSGVTYLVSQFKVNFRPLYTEVVKALAGLCGKHGQVVWEVVWGEIEKIQKESQAIVADLEVVNPSWATANGQRERRRDQGDGEEEAEYRCHNLEKGNQAVDGAWKESSDGAQLDHAEIKTQVSQDHLNVLSYEGQLFAALVAYPSIAEKHTRLVVPAFFSIAGIADEGETSPALQLSRRQRQERTAHYLELLAKFVNPKAAFRSDELHDLYLSILSKGDPKLQGLALRCLLTFKSPNLLPYQDRLDTLLDDAKFRDTLTHFSLGLESDVINPSHRAELLPVTIRLLYGIITSRRGRSSTAQGQSARKQAVLSALSGCASEELKTLVDLMLEPFEETSPEQLAGRQQMGFMSLLQDVIRYLGPQTAEHWPRLLQQVVELVSSAQRRLTRDAADDDVEVDAREQEELELEQEDEDKPEKGTAPLRAIRTTGIKRFVQFLRSPTDFDFSPFLPRLFEAIISPRLDKLEIENTQAPSGTLDLIAALAHAPDTAYSLAKYDERTLPKVFACMTGVKVKPAVIGRVFDIVDSLLFDETAEEEDQAVTRDVLLPYIRPLLDNIIGLVQNLSQAANEDITRRLLSILSRLSSIVSDGEQAQQLAALLGPMLRQPTRQLPEKAKLNILITLQRLYSISPAFADPQSEFFKRNYDLVANLFGTLFLPASRQALVGVLETFAVVDSSLADSIKRTGDINSFSKRRMEEPDFERRLAAYAQIIDADEKDLPRTLREWLPLLRSGLFYLHEPDELSIRTNASALLRRYVSLVGSASGGPLVEAISTVILPGLRRTLRSKVELVRTEALLVLSHAIKTCTAIPLLVELRSLTPEDDETNFFINVSHIQVHRRARALRRLRDLLALPSTQIREQTISTIFLPVAEHILAGSTEVTDHHLVNEAVNTVGSLSRHLRWPKWNALVMRYLKFGAGKGGQQKIWIRAVASVIDGFHFDLKDTNVPVASGEDGKDEGEEVAAEQDGVEIEQDVLDSAPTAIETTPERIIQVVIDRLLPALSNFVAQKDEAEAIIRIPLAVGTVKLASELPGTTADNEILKNLTIVSQILRSKEQDTRDIARDTICKIAVYLGPGWLVRVLKELRSALQRGPQKHVLAVVTHAILVLATTEASDRFADLDGAVQDAIEVSAEVIWGESGKDVQSEGFRTKMREVRGATSRGFDTFQLVSRLASPSKIGTILAPLRETMHASQAVKTMQHIDEALRRIALGLNANAKLEPKDILNLCHSLISGNSGYATQAKRKEPAADEGEPKAKDSFRVQMKRNDKQADDFFALNAHRFVGFGLDLFVTAFRRGKFDFEDLVILSRLGPLVNAIGNTMYSTTSSVLLLSLKASAAISRCPIPQVEPALPVFVANVFRILKRAGGTAESDVAQTALKTLSVILRDCKSSTITENQLRYLLEVIAPDLEEPDRQSAIFAILRAILARKFVVPEVYDLMDRVSSIMVTSQSSHVQELCRGALIAFLLDYPQGKGRLKAQMTFLAQNLEYVYESGRSSVLELLSGVLHKFSDGVVDDYADLFFVALVAVLANDESEKCRTMAGVLIGVLYGRMSEGMREKTRSVLKSWIEARQSNKILAATAMTVLGLLVESARDEADKGRLAAEVVEGLGPIVGESAQELAEAEASESAFDPDLDHVIPNQALTAISKALKATPSLVNAIPWTDVTPLLLFPHDWVRFTTAKLLAQLFALPNAFDLLDQDAQRDVARKGCLLLQGSRGGDDGKTVVGVDGKVADQVVKVLWNLAKHWAASDSTMGNGKVEVVDEEGEDEEDDGPSRGRPLAWLMSRMSFIARHLIVNRPSPHAAIVSDTPWTAPVMSILRFFAGVFEALSVPQAKGFLMHTLSPVYRILDEGGDLTSADSGPGIDELRQLALEVREFVQAKVGTTEFSHTWEGLRRRVAERREVRRDARNRLAVHDPKGFAERKGKRVVMKKESKKRKVKAFSEGKLRPNKRRA